ncbi:hypothetical protein GCM10009854_37830 [Saccharopolyspora halophila]|uniref:PPE domain-containing protein n=2 Tax=Saccharopolyspora halophila TaxID=405551 RepID=A0ABP5TMZ9_9PSEU
MLEMCYASSAKEYRKQMGGAPDATSIPTPTDEGVQKWDKVAQAFDQMNDDIASALRAAEAAHTGAAADAANASIGEIKPIVDAAAQTSRQVKDALVEQDTNQHSTFQSLPNQGDTLPSGQQAILDPPQKGWVEDWGLDSNPVTGWMSDYEDRQQAYMDTNTQANQAMERYSTQTEANIGRLPEFQPVDQAPPPGAQQPVGVTPTSGSYTSGGSGSDYGGAAYSGAAPAGTSSASAAPAGAPTAGAGALGSSSPAPAGTSSAWAQTPGGTGVLPPGVVRGPDGALYRKNPQTGTWERQVNGRWISAGSNPGGRKNSGGNGGAAAPLAGRGGGFAGRGIGEPGMGGARGFGEPGAGGRAGAGALGAGQAGAPGAAGARGANGMGAGAGAAGRGTGAQGEEEAEPERPSWLIEEEDVWTNDMQRTAPPVFGDVASDR